MKGLILKDMYNLSHNSKQLIIMLLFFGVCFSPSGGGGSVIVMSTVMCMTMVITTFSFDERSGWNKYALIMPITRKDIVSSKYIISLLASLTGLAFGVVWSIGLGIFKKELDFQMIGVTALVGVLLAVIFATFLIPSILKFGTEKSRYILMAVVAVPTLIMYFVMSKVNKPEFTDSMIFKLIIVAAAVIIVLYVASYFVSLKIMKNKEF